MHFQKEWLQMEYFYEVYTAKGNLVISTKNFDLALYTYAHIDTKSGWPVFAWKAIQASAISGYPEAFLFPQIV